jgi:hypothetical protein
VTGGQKPHPRGQLRGNIDHVHTVLAQAPRQRRTQAGCALDRPVDVRPLPGESAKRSVTVVADRDRRWWLTDAARRRPRLRSTTPCADQQRSSPVFRNPRALAPSPTPQLSFDSVARRAHQLSALQASLQPLLPSAPAGDAGRLGANPTAG